MAIGSPSVNTDTYAENAVSGWDAADEVINASKSDEYTKEFKFSDEPTLVKFLGDGPFKVYAQHWIERQGKKSFVCLRDSETGCPLCDVLGDEPRNKFAFSVVVFKDGETPELQMLIAPPSLFRLLKNAHADQRKGPLNKHYWALSRTGSGPKTTYIVDMVRERDLADEWALDPVNAQAAIDGYEPLTPEVVYVGSYESLMDIAKETA